LLFKNKPWEDYDDGVRSLVSAIRKITQTGQVTLDEGVTAEKPKRGAARKTVSGARKATRKRVPAHGMRPSHSTRVAGRP
jgi:hypothetical protein